MRLLNSYLGTPDGSVDPTDQPTTTTTQTTTTTAPTQPPTLPPNCNNRCMFDTLASPAITERFVRILRENQYFGFLLRLPFNSRSYIVKKVSTATDEKGNNPIWTVVEDRVASIVDYRVEIGDFFGSIGINFQDIESVRRSYGDDFAINTIVPFKDSKVFVILNKKTDCNQNQFIQVNYTRDPESLVNPISYGNLLGDTATFDVSFTPGLRQLYAHNTLKLPHGLTCDCQTRINLNKQALKNARSIRLDSNLIIVDVNSYYVDNNLLFTLTLCTEDCLTGRGCISRIEDSILVDDMTEDNYLTRISGMKAAKYEIIDLAPYYENGKLYFVGVFIRPRYV